AYVGPSKSSYRSKASTDCCNINDAVIKEANRNKNIDIAGMSNVCRINGYEGSPFNDCFSVRILVFMKLAYTFTYKLRLVI
ncbi:MAG: hypothetical protein ACJ70W_00535, partial [Nitrososphaera sp.]